MKLLNLNSPQDFMALMVRRKWWIAIPFVALSCAVVVLTFILPKMYESNSLILITPREVPNEMVRDLTSGSTEQRLTAIDQTVRSRTNLVEVLREFEDKLPDYKNLNMDDKVQKIRSQINVAYGGENRIGNGQVPVSYFRISFQNRSPEVAQKIVAKLTALFIEQDNKGREASVYALTEFFSGELTKIADQLKVSDNQLKDMRLRHPYDLQTETNLRTLDRLSMEKSSSTDALDRSKQSLLSLDGLMAQTPQTITRQLPIPYTPPPVVVAPNPQLEEYRIKLLEVKALLGKGFKEEHPDVLQARKHLDSLKNDLTPEELASLDKKEEKPVVAAGPPAPTTETVPNPAYQNYQVTKDALVKDIDIRERAVKTIDADIELYKRRVMNSPAAEQEVKDLLRQNNDLNKQYEAMKAKLDDAKLSESAESRQKGSQFKVQDAASYPITPVKPEKAKIVGIGTIISLLLGLALAVVVDVANQKMWTMSDIESFLGVTVLVEIPHIVTVSDLLASKKKRVNQLISLAAGSVAYGVCLYLIYSHQAFVLRHLDPFIQRFY